MLTTVPVGMRQGIFCLVFVVMSAVARPVHLRGQEAPADPILATDPVVQASLERIGRGSALWRNDVEAARQTGRHALVLTSRSSIRRAAGVCGASIRRCWPRSP